MSTNPFTTRRVRPGAIDYLFPAGVSAQTLVERLALHGWRGEIVGPHGSGKSTLLATLVAALRAAGREPLVVALHDGQRRLPMDLARESLPEHVGLIVIDGYEQLSRWNRLRVRRLCRSRRWGLLITAHVPQGLPTIFRTTITHELVRQVVAQLLPPDAAPVSDETLVQLYEQHGGNLREILFDLYDRFEQQRSAPGISAS